MNKVVNWFCGSFIRTLGRFLAFVVIGMLVASLISANDIKFDISSLLGIQRVHAETFTHQVYFNGSNYFYIDSSNDYTLTGEYLTKSFSGTGLKTLSFGVSSTSSDVIKTHSYFQFNYIIGSGATTLKYELSENDVPVCATWVCIDSSNNSQNTMNCACQTYNTSNNYIYDIEYPTENSITDLQIYARVWYNNNSWYSVCNINNNNVICPTNGQNVSKIDFIVYNNNNYSDIQIVIPRSIIHFDDVDVTSAINSQSQTQHQDSENTQNVIQSTTNQTIENQNQNTQQTINSQMICKQIDKNNVSIFGQAYRENFTTFENSNFGITDFINVFKGTLKFLTTQDQIYPSYCLFDVNKTLISCYSNNDTNIQSHLTDNVYYARFSINVSQNKPQIELCLNGNQAMADTLTDSNTAEASGEADSFFSGFSVSDNGGLSGIITAPLSAIQSITSSSCSPLVLPLPFINQNLTLPCMRQIYLDNFGGFMTLYDIITLGIISYWIIVRIFNLVKDFKNPEHDEIEVVDL